MKKLLILFMVVAMMVSVVACAGNGNNETTGSTVTTESTGTTGTTAVIAPGVNAGTLKVGVYKSSASYAMQGMNMTWNFVLTLKDDNTFTLTDGTTEKGAGTYALTGDCYTLTYNDDRTCTFVVQEDGTLRMLSDFPYGFATIQLALVGDIVFTYDSEVPAEGGNDNQGGDDNKGDDTVYSIVAGTYGAEYTKESAMAGTVVYKYTAVLGADNTFSYSVKFDMKGTAYDGASASGTYKVEGNKFTFTDSEGNVTEGVLTADNTFKISLKASAMASTPYEVTFTEKVFTVAAGTYGAEYTKESAMAGTVVYKYTAVLGADNTFSYSVKFDMKGTAYDGASASGTYKVEGNKFTFTDSEGNVTEGVLTADNTFKISLKASAMASTPYEVTFTVPAAE